MCICVSLFLVHYTIITFASARSRSLSLSLSKGWAHSVEDGALPWRLWHLLSVRSGSLQFRTFGSSQVTRLLKGPYDCSLLLNSINFQELSSQNDDPNTDPLSFQCTGFEAPLAPAVLRPLHLHQKLAQGETLSQQVFFFFCWYNAFNRYHSLCSCSCFAMPARWRKN